MSEAVPNLEVVIPASGAGEEKPACGQAGLVVAFVSSPGFV